MKAISIEQEVTEREKKFVKLLSEGKRASDMFKIVGLKSASAVESELFKIRVKYGVKKTASLVAFFYKHGLID